MKRMKNKWFADSGKRFWLKNDHRKLVFFYIFEIDLL